MPITLSDDGGWCWFEHPRAIVHGGKLIVGAVASGWRDERRRGDIEAIVHDLASGETVRVRLHGGLELDDHDTPAFLARPDGRLLTLYGKHSEESRFYFRVSEPSDPTRWGPVREFVSSPTTRLAYANLFHLPSEGGRLYDFFRGLDDSFKPSYAFSDDLGESWTAGNVFIDLRGGVRHRPYTRFASNARDTVHVFYTEGHPRDFDNGVYHVFYRAGWLHTSDGQPIARLIDGLERPEQGTRIFRGDADHVAWTSDIVLDGQDRPCVTYSVQIGSAGLPVGQGGDDLRYRYARWDGQAWNDHALAYAGTRLYAGEDDYSGLAALDPGNPDVVFISTNAEPMTGRPLMSGADGQRHWEIFRGVTADQGRTWTWTAVTRDSREDNLRPIALRGEGQRPILLWLRGRYHSYTSYELNVVALIDDPQGS